MYEILLSIAYMFCGFFSYMGFVYMDSWGNRTFYNYNKYSGFLKIILIVFIIMFWIKYTFNLSLIDDLSFKFQCVTSCLVWLITINKLEKSS